VGRIGISVFVVVEGIGSYAGTEIAPGTYTATIPGADLEYETTYSYHFSNASGGEDLSPSLGGTFTTPEEPPVTWSISSATVKVDKDRNWEVTVLGGEGQQVYIVIDGIGSFLLNESSPGRYTATIDGSNFEWEEDYSYHFSPTEGGNAPAGFEIYSGSVSTGSEPVQATNWGAIMGVTCLVLLFLMLMLSVILFFVLRKKDEKDPFEE
jgi:hypothetical protein